MSFVPFSLKFSNFAKGSHCEQCSAMVTSLEPETKGTLGDWREDSLEVTRIFMRIVFSFFSVSIMVHISPEHCSSVEEL